MGSGGRPSSFLTELLSPFLARLHLHYRYCCVRRWKLTHFTLNHGLRRICYSDFQKVVHLFSMTKPQENKKKTGDFNFTCTLGIVATNKKRLLCVTVTA